LQHNIIWGQKGNFLDVPTDCPQRNERLGWTGDAQVFAPTACFNMQCGAFYTRWLKDLAADQHEDGAVPWVVPNVLGRGEAHGWADAALIVPWNVYLYYGDKRILEEQYESMKGWVEYLRGQSGDSYLWKPKERQFGDWLSFATTRSDYPGATTDKDLTATAYFYHSTNLLGKTAEILGKKEDATKYKSLQGKIKEAFNKEYVTPNGRLSSNTQTAYVVALSFGLLPENMEKPAAERLAADVKSFGHITTGFLGTADICHILSKYGYLDEAYMLLYRKDYPSWLYPVTRDATTIWERWDGIKPDGTFQNAGMNSFNHYAYGAVGDWLYRVVAGINPDPQTPGFKKIIVKPHPGNAMNNVSASHESSYGTIKSEWLIKDNTLSLKVTIPANTSAEVFVPSTGRSLSINGKVADANELVKDTGLRYHFLKAELESGSYELVTEFGL
jgi:alpha-L-rhamnosidase